MNLFNVSHQSFEESDSDLSLSASWSIEDFLTFTYSIDNIISHFLELLPVYFQTLDLAFRYALLRLRMFHFFSVVIHGNSEGRVIICLFGIDSLNFAIDKIVDMMFSEYISTLLL